MFVYFLLNVISKCLSKLFKKKKKKAYWLNSDCRYNVTVAFFSRTPLRVEKDSIQPLFKCNIHIVATTRLKKKNLDKI